MVDLPKVFVVPGAGVKVPLPVPGQGRVPAAGATVVRNSAVERLIIAGDLVEGTAPAMAPAAPAAAAAKGDK